MVQAWNLETHEPGKLRIRWAQPRQLREFLAGGRVP